MMLQPLPKPSNGNALYWRECDGHWENLKKLNLFTGKESILDSYYCNIDGHHDNGISYGDLGL